jgi:phosphonopyruvate decarboxylase
MKVEALLDTIDAKFYTGVPDSCLKSLCDYLMKKYGINEHRHVIAANEGNAAAVAAGYYLATRQLPVVYMQNSGIGNIINPLASLLNEKVYGIPCVFIIGWRGEPEVQDEPQHIFQGEVTCRLLQDMDVEYRIISKDTQLSEVEEAMQDFRVRFSKGKSAAFVVRKGALEYDEIIEYKNQYILKREDAIRSIVSHAGKDIIVSTTGKASRELFEIREEHKDSHERDFLTVGSMGHASSIALGIAINKQDKKIWCIDGDGAVLMHMGAMAVIARNCPANLIHIVINNGAHESVGGQPTVLGECNVYQIAHELGYEYSVCVRDEESLERELKIVERLNKLTFIEVKCAIGAREDLGRPLGTPKENKELVMKYLRVAERNQEV